MSRKRKHNSKILKKKSRLNRDFFYRFIRRAGVYTACVALCLWMISWVWFAGVVQSGVQWTEDKILALSSQAGFEVENLLVEGRYNLDADTLMVILNIKDGQPLFQSDIEEMRLKIQALEWVESAEIQRRQPDTLYVKIQERVPVALLKNDGQKLYLLDAKGRIIDVPLQAKFKDLIITTGKNVEKEAFEFVRVLSGYPDISGHIDMAQWVSERRWDIITKERTRIQMPEKNLDYALGRLDELQRKSGILTKPLDLIDLRQTDRVIARPKEGHSFDYNYVAPASGGGYEL